MRRSFTGLLVMATLLMSLTGCFVDNHYASLKEQIKADVEREVSAIEGVDSVNAHVNTNTSGKWIDVSIQTDATDKEEMGRILEAAVKPAVESLDYVEDASLSMMIQSSSDKSNLLNASDVGINGGGRLEGYREALGVRAYAKE